MPDMATAPMQMRRATAEHPSILGLTRRPGPGYLLSQEKRPHTPSRVAEGSALRSHSNRPVRVRARC